jgi:hypothetical protein
MKWAKRKEAEVVKSDVTGLCFDFKSSEYVQVLGEDESYFRRQGHEIVESEEYPGKETKPTLAPKVEKKEEPKSKTTKKGDK